MPDRHDNRRRKSRAQHLGAWSGASIAVSVVLAGMIFACGREAPASRQADGQPSQEVNACSFLTAGEIQEVTGQTPGNPVPEARGTNFFECRWPAADGSEFQLAFVAYRPTRSPTSYSEWVEQYKAGMGEDFSESDLSAYEQVGGLGAFALYLDAGNLGGQIQVYRDGRMLQVAASKVAGSSNRDVSIDLASKAMARLP